MIELNNNNFDEEITAYEGTAIIDCYAKYCYPCRILMPVFNAAEKDCKNIKFAKINTEKEEYLCQNLRIQSLPSFLFFKNGVEISRMTGEINALDLRRKIQELN